MFVNIFWKTNDEVKKAVIPADKTDLILKEFEKRGVEAWFEFEKPTSLIQ
jgi:hypothetical protein